MAQQVLQSRQPPRAVGRFVSRPVVGFEDAFKSGLKEFVLQELKALGEVDAVFQALAIMRSASKRAIPSSN